jgi:hypothetical protein
MINDAILYIDEERNSISSLCRSWEKLFLNKAFLKLEIKSGSSEGSSTIIFSNSSFFSLFLHEGELKFESIIFWNNELEVALEYNISDIQIKENYIVSFITIRVNNSFRICLINCSFIKCKYDSARAICKKNACMSIFDGNKLDRQRSK